MAQYQGTAEDGPFLTSIGLYHDEERVPTQPHRGGGGTTAFALHGGVGGSRRADEVGIPQRSARTGVDRGSADENEAASTQTTAPLVPFVSPPPPVKLSLKPRYYSLAGSETGTAHAMSNWEKEALLARTRKCTPLDEKNFQLRLSRTRQRNADGNINAVRCCVKEHEEDVELARVRDYLAHEQRRELVFFHHKNLLQLRAREKFVARAQWWYRIVVSHVFVTALIQERKVQEALNTFSHLMTPMIRCHLALKRRRREAQELTKRELPNIPFPHPQVIQSMYGTFFNGWPPLLLEKLVENASPAYLRKGSYLMHEGDIGRVMYMITTGTVSIILRKKGRDKRRTKENSSGVFQITAPCYVGEFALVCKEPRSASIYCETDIGFWAVSPEDYEDVARHLSAEVASKQREATDVRRRQNLQKFFPLKVDFLRKFPYFERFSDASLEKVISCVEPLVLHDGDYLFRCGERDSSVYFIQDGTAVRRDRDGHETKVVTGSCVGMFECSCGVNERKQYSIVSVNYCDVWRMRRETLVDVGMSEPIALLHCRASAKADRALEIHREARTPAFLRNDPYLSFCLPASYVHKLYALCTPLVYLNGEKLTVMGQTVSALVILLSGSVDVTVTSSGEQETFRLDATELKARYSTSEPSQGARAASIQASSGAGLVKGVGSGTSGAKTSRATLPADAERDGRPVPAKNDKAAAHSLSSAFTAVLGAYELAASIPQYTCTATSFGLTEALLVDRSKLEAILPSTLRAIMHDDVRAREIVRKAHKRGSLDLLAQSSASSFAQLYKDYRDGERDRPQKNGSAKM